MRYLTILTMLSFGFYGCFTDTEDTTEVIIKPVPSITIAFANVVVKVQDESGQPVSGLTARFNKTTKIVDNASIFHFTGNNISKENELLTLTTAQGKTYEFNLYNVENQINYHQITLFSQIKQSTFSSRETQVLPLPSNSFELQFKPQVYQSGALDYAGEIKAEYIDYDIANPIHKQGLPGGNIVVYNGVKKVIKLQKAFHLILQTPDEKSLQWNLPHTGVFNQSFPEGSYLLYYDEKSHQWKIITELSKQNEFPVTASGTYIVAGLEDFHVVSGNWSIDDNPLISHDIQISSSDFNTIVHSSNTGYWEAVVPANRDITIKALFSCPTDIQIQMKTIGEKTVTGNKNFSEPNLTFIEATGNMLGCDHQPLSEGFLLAEGPDRREVVFIEEHQFSLKLPICAAPDWNISVKSGNITSTALKANQSSISFGNVYVCEDLRAEYIAVETGDGYENLYQSIQFEDDGQQMIMETENALLKFYVKLKHTGTTGIIPNENGNIIWRDPNFNNTGIEIECPSSSSCGFELIELTRYTQDEWVRGSFNGRFWTKTFDPLSAKYQNVHVDFQLKKQ